MTDRPTTTAAEATQAGALVISHPFNLGIGGAVQSGFAYALDNDYDYLVQVDGDGQHEPRHVPDLMAAMQDDPDIDMVCGSRFLSEDFEYPAPDQPAHRDPHLRVRPVADRRAAHQRPDIGVPAVQPSRDHRVRAGLPA